MGSMTILQTSPFYHRGVSGRDSNLSNIMNSQAQTNNSIPPQNSRSALQNALKKAKQAVEFDHINDFQQALLCYEEALSLITNVLDSSPVFRTNPRLMSIQNSYLERVTLLTSLIETVPESNFMGQEMITNIENASFCSDEDQEYSATTRMSIFNDGIGGSYGLTEPKNPRSPNYCDNEDPLAEGQQILTVTLDTITSWAKDYTHIPSYQNKINAKKDIEATFNTTNKLGDDKTITSTLKDGHKYREETELLQKTSGLTSTNSSKKDEASFNKLSIQTKLSNGEEVSTSHSHATLSTEHSSPISSRKSLSVIFETELNGPSLMIKAQKFEADSADTTPSITSLEIEKPTSINTRLNNDAGSKSSLYDSTTERPSFDSITTSPRMENLRMSTITNRRLSSLPTSPRPSSFLLASSKVVDMAVNSQTTLSRSSSRQYNLVSIQRVFREEPSENCVFEAPPVSSDLRVFWLMRSLEKSMTVGGYVSRKLFIPKSVWHQNGVRLLAIEIKAHSCEVLADFLGRFRSIELSDTSKILKELEQLDVLLNSIQNGLAKKLTFVEPLKRMQSSALSSLSSKISKSVERIQNSYLKLKTDSSSQYIDTVIKLFKASQFLEKWYQHFVAMPSLHSAHTQIVARLNRVNGFLYSVICAFVIRDMSVLLAKYLKRLKTNISD